jgi:hypothetical protein
MAGGDEVLKMMGDVGVGLVDGAEPVDAIGVQVVHGVFDGVFETAAASSGNSRRTVSALSGPTERHPPPTPSKVGRTAAHEAARRKHDHTRT